MKFTPHSYSLEDVKVSESQAICKAQYFCKNWKDGICDTLNCVDYNENKKRENEDMDGATRFVAE